MKEELSMDVVTLNTLYTKATDFIYNLSVVKDATASGGSSNTGIIIVGMIIIVAGLIGFTITKNGK